MPNCLLKGSSLCLALKDFSVPLITLCTSRNMEWVWTFMGEFQVGLNTSELGNRINQIG